MREILAETGQLPPTATTTERSAPGATAVAPEAPPPSRRLARFAPQPADVAAITCFVALAVFVLYRQWRNLGTGYLLRSGQDQNMWEWFFSVAAHSLVNLQNPLGSDLQNHPLGVNLMGNTAMFGFSIPFAPVTLLFGPTVTFALALTVGLAGTAIAWYWVLSRHVVSSRFAAAVGGLVCGFAPAMISHANGHPNFVALFLLPFIALGVVRLGSSERQVRDGIVLGLLIAYQIFLGEEPLLIYALTFCVFGLVYAMSRPKVALAAVRRGIPGFAVAGAVALAIAAFPLWWQFFGPNAYSALEHGPVGNDVQAITSFPTESLAGAPADMSSLRMNATEENAFFGWPLLLLIAVSGLWLWRMPLARAATATAVAMGVLSLGSELTVSGTGTGITLPWALLADQPLFESVLESRFAMGVIPAAALLLALGTDRALASSRSGQAPLARDGQRSTAFLWFAWLAIALIPLAPTPLEVVPRAQAPAFFDDGIWRDYVDDGSVVAVPLSSPQNARLLHWQAEQDVGFPIAGGYFVGPAGPDDLGKYGPEDRPTALFLREVEKTGTIPAVDEATRAQARADLEFWNADVLVLAKTRNDRVLQEAVNQLVGVQGERVGGTWVWDVRAVV